MFIVRRLVREASTVIRGNREEIEQPKIVNHHSKEPSRLIARIGKLGDSPGRFNVPIGITSTRQGEIVIADSGNNRIQVLATSGEPLRSIGKEGPHDHSLNTPHDVAITSEGHIAVTDGLQCRVKLFNMEDGKFLRFLDKNVRFALPYGLAVTQNNYIVVTDVRLHNVTVLYPSGGMRCRFGGQGSEAYQLDHPYFVCLTRDRRIIVSDQGNAAVKIFSFGGALEQYFGVEDFRLLDDSFITLEGVMVDDDDNIVLVVNDCVCILLSDGKLWKILTPEDGLRFPKAVTYLRKGSLIVVTEYMHEKHSCLSLFTHELEYFKPFKRVPTRKRLPHACESYHPAHNERSSRREDSVDIGLP